MATGVRRYVSQLGDKEQVDQVFLVNDKQLRPNRAGNLYLQCQLMDRSGAISARLWNATQEDYRSFENGDYVHVEGTTQVFQGAIQLIATRIRRAIKSEVDDGDFVSLTRPQIDRMAGRLAELLRKVKNPPLRNLVECFLMDEEFMRRFCDAPAGIKHHHAYEGGLLEHVISLVELVALVGPHYPELDVELLTIGAFIHDVGKIDELASGRELTYTDEGQLLGHIVLGISILDAKIRQSEQLSNEAFPPELAASLKHMLVSHHGEYEYGSPRLPMTLEATALHLLDNLDARLHNFMQLMRSDANVDSPWTQFHHHLGRKLYKGIPD